MPDIFTITISNLIQVILVALGTIGFFLARFIKNKKKEKKRLVCPLRSDCTTVIHSSYSRFAGLPVERIGMWYYSIVVLFYLTIIFNLPGAELAYDIAIWISSIAFAFSIYLVLVQIFKLKQFCFWCLCSAVICLVIFLGTLVLHLYF